MTQITPMFAGWLCIRQAKDLLGDLLAIDRLKHWLPVVLSAATAKVSAI